jgi:hypothetical protein
MRELPCKKVHHRPSEVWYSWFYALDTRQVSAEKAPSQLTYQVSFRTVSTKSTMKAISLRSSESVQRHNVDVVINEHA